jgi:pimeloyl-ACP methyl ester carboxylesterase
MKSKAANLLVTAGTFAAAGVTAKVFKDRSDGKKVLEALGDDSFGSVHGRHEHVTSPDNLSIHIEVDTPRNSEEGIPTIVFLHGWMCDLDSWHFQRLALRQQARMVFIDLRSHGKSSRSDAASSSLDFLADDLDAVLESTCGPADEPGPPIILVGHSMGGMTIMKLAITHPEWFEHRVAGTVLVATSSGHLMKRSPGLRAISSFLRSGQAVLDWGREFNSRTIIRRVVLGSYATDLAVEMSNAMILHMSSTVIADFLPNFLDLDLSAGLPAIAKTRTVIVGGTADQLTPFSHSKWMHNHIAGSELDAVTGAGHMVMFEEPDQVTDAILRVLRDVS